MKYEPQKFKLACLLSQCIAKCIVNFEKLAITSEEEKLKIFRGSCGNRLILKELNLNFQSQVFWLSQFKAFQIFRIFITAYYDNLEQGPPF